MTDISTQQYRRILLQCCSATLLFSTLFSGYATAQDDFFSTIEVDTSARNRRTDMPFSLFGWVTQKVSHGFESPGPLFSRSDKELNKIETSLFLQLDTDFGAESNFRISAKAYHDEIYRFNDDTRYSDDERNEFRNRFEIKDFYIERQYDNGFYLKIGKQMLAWGLAEYSRVTDLINTEDQYTFGQQDLEDIRLQVPAILASYATAGWVFDSVVTYRAGSNDIAPDGDEFDQFITIRDSGLTLLRKDTKQDTEYFFRASTHFARGDFQLVLGEFNDNALTVDQISAVKSVSPRVTYRQNRMRALGIAANWVGGSWLYFGELGMHLDQAVRPNSDAFFRQLNGWDQKDQLLSVLGIEYSGFRNLLLTFEIDSIHTRDHDAFMQADEDQISFGSRLYWTALNERIQVLAVWKELADNAGRVSRISVDYNWSDSLDLGLMWVDYHSDDNSMFYEFRNNDVFQLQFRYNFQI